MSENIIQIITTTVVGAGVGFIFGICVFGFLAACKTLWVVLSKKFRSSPSKTFTRPSGRTFSPSEDKYQC